MERGWPGELAAGVAAETVETPGARYPTPEIFADANRYPTPHTSPL